MRFKKNIINRCIFCGFEGKLTAEHITSKRYHRLIPRTSKSYKMLRTVEFRDHSTYKIGKRTADPRDWKVKCVCEKNCNNGWMRELDAKADPVLAPLITGQGIRLTPEQQTLVSTWAIMKAIVAEYEDEDGSTTHHMHRKRMFNKRVPPEQGWLVWIGHYPRKVWQTRYTHTPFQFVRDEILAKRSDDTATYYNASITTYLFGELFIQICHAPKKFGISRFQFPRLPDGGMVRCIWPASQYSLLWPLSPLSDRDTDLATDAMRFIIARNARARPLKQGASPV